jgi:hypothetical protein
MTKDNTCHSNNSQRDGAEFASGFNTLALVPVCQANDISVANYGTGKSNQISLHV